jgi:hypothetical protein
MSDERRTDHARRPTYDSTCAEALVLTLHADLNDVVLDRVHRFLEENLTYAELGDLATASHSLWRACREVRRRRELHDHARDNRVRWDSVDVRNPESKYGP